MKYIVTINDKSYEVEVEKGQANIVGTTQVAPVPVQAVVNTNATVVETTAPVAPPAQAGTSSGEPIKAPMPGTIIAVQVNQGAAVKKGDVLFIMEAMKMESEITAAKDGVVSQIMVGKGASVSTGDILLMLQ
ncbi:MAG: biotin/lipoyl-binding protein [Syntrophomonadaceae bacterium]|nr:biotin/lipoyl-binding protein [Syntrophomonadaceae bacterium]